MQKILLSIIIPCRNGGKWIPQIAASIEQSDLEESEYEIIFVDDASEDNTYLEMLNISSMRKNVRVIKLDQHLFLGGARNRGLIESRGNFVWFVDADDLIVKSGCFAALRTACNENLDVLGFEYCKVDNGGSFIRNERAYKEYVRCDGVTFAKNAFNGNLSSHMGFVWRYLYRRKYLIENNIRFAEGVCWEDTVFMPEAIIKAKRVGAIPDVLYKYRQNQNSISGTMHKKYPAQLIYDFAFTAGKDLLNYAQTIEDEQLREDLFNTAINKYLNGFLLFLLRTSTNELNIFYKLIRENKEQMRQIHPYLNKSNRVLLAPIVGKGIVAILSSAYKIKHAV